MEVQTVRLGPYRTNCHILHDRQNAWIIDPGFDGGLLAARIKAQGWEVRAVLLTHSHWDHVLGIPGLREVFPELPIYLHEADQRFLGKAGSAQLRQLAFSIDPSQRSIPADLWESLPEATHLLEDGMNVEGCELLVLHTPGHTPGSVCLYRETDALLFSGDTLFAGSIGRTDLPGSNPDSIVPAIQQRLLVLPEPTVVYPGHGPATTIGKQIRQNPWL